MKNSSALFADYLPRINNPCSFAFNPVSHVEIELEILKIPMGKAYGLYSCPVRILKSACYIL